jgi:stress response protein YsnF
MISTASRMSRRASGETVIPTAREELKVGKREVEDTHQFRIRRYTVERPAEAQVELQTETVEIERRVPRDTTVAAEQPFEEKIVEVIERREEPVIGKETKPGEDVVVRKSLDRRTETVQDTVRESKVDVDRQTAGNKPNR